MLLLLLLLLLLLTTHVRRIGEGQFVLRTAHEAAEAAEGQIGDDAGAADHLWCG